MKNWNFNTELPEEFWALRDRKIQEAFFPRRTEHTRDNLQGDWELFCKMWKTAYPNLQQDFNIIYSKAGVLIRRRTGTEQKKEVEFDVPEMFRKKGDKPRG